MNVNHTDTYSYLGRAISAL